MENCNRKRSIDLLPLKKLNWDRLIPLIGKAREELARYDESIKKISHSDFEIMKRKEINSSLLGHTHLKENEKEHVKESLDFAIRWAKKHPINIEFFCKIHAIARQDRSNHKEIGRIRVKQNWIGPQGKPIEKAYFIPPSPQKVRPLLKNLILYGRREEKDPLVQAAIFFAQFLIIHPFMDGNGRVARIFISVFLWKKRMTSKPCLFLSNYFATHRFQYFKKLFYISKRGAWEEWIIFFLEGVIHESKKLKKNLH